MSDNISMAALGPLLHRAGLSDREANVYLALLSLKIARPTQIARAAGQSRSHTYLVLRALEKKGLVAEVERGKIIHFTAESPQRLLHYVEDRREELQNVESLIAGAMPLLSSLSQQVRDVPRVTVLHGLDGVKQVYRDVLRETFVSFFNPQIDYDAFGCNIVYKLFGPHAQLRGKDLLVRNEGAERYIREVPQNDAYEIRVLPPGITFDADVIVYGDTTAIFTFAEEPTTIQIDNHQLANAVRAWFEALWALGTPAHSPE